MAVSRVLLLAVFALFSIVASADNASGPSLRELAKQLPSQNFMVGGTAGWKEAQGASGQVLDREFGFVTPENEFKQRIVHPQPGVWDWELADAWLERVADRKQVMRVHAPVGPQSSEWAKDDSRTGDELRLVMREFVEGMAKRVDGKPQVIYWDVVNETVLPNGKWNGAAKGEKGWENPWVKMGYDDASSQQVPKYIAEAFAIASSQAPGVKLIINQNGSMQPRMWAQIKGLVGYLRGKGLRVDGIGWQAHVDVGWEKKDGNLEKLSELIDWAHRNRLSFHVTENNVWMRKGAGDLDAQADTFGAIFGLLLKMSRQGTVTWNVWNISDRDVMERKSDWKGCLFDDQHQPKPAYFEIRRLLMQAVGSASVDPAGPANPHTMLSSLAGH